MMKQLCQKLLLLISACVLLTSFIVNKEIDEIVAAIKAGNSSKLAVYFDKRVDIALPGKSDNYSSKQGEVVMRDFFSLNTVRSFQIKHTGENKDGSKYYTGTLQTKTGDYRVTLFLKQKGKNLVLQQVSILLME